VGLTADDVKAKPEIEQNAMSSGMNELIIKPVSIELLQDLVTKYD
jgi:hypothetical protein